VEMTALAAGAGPPANKMATQRILDLICGGLESVVGSFMAISRCPLEASRLLRLAEKASAFARAAKGDGVESVAGNPLRATTAGRRQKFRGLPPVVSATPAQGKAMDRALPSLRRGLHSPDHARIASIAFTRPRGYASGGWENRTMGPGLHDRYACRFRRFTFSRLRARRAPACPTVPRCG
jgi:hypothetical protein